MDFSCLHPKHNLQRQNDVLKFQIEKMANTSGKTTGTMLTRNPPASDGTTNFCVLVYLVDLLKYQDNDLSDAELYSFLRSFRTDLKSHE